MRELLYGFHRFSDLASLTGAPRGLHTTDGPAIAVFRHECGAELAPRHGVPRGRREIEVGRFALVGGTHPPTFSP